MGEKRAEDMFAETFECLFTAELNSVAGWVRADGGLLMMSVPWCGSRFAIGASPEPRREETSRTLPILCGCCGPMIIWVIDANRPGVLGLKYSISSCDALFAFAQAG